ncbi:MAG: hypothetical protein ACYSWW_19540 [Planctomycetota bacterium]
MRTQFFNTGGTAKARQGEDQNESGDSDNLVSHDKNSQLYLCHLSIDKYIGSDAKSKCLVGVPYHA